MEDTGLEISLDKLPIKRLEVIEENGLERFPSDVGYDEKRVNLIRRIDFAWAVEREEPKSSKKQKKSTNFTASGRSSSTSKEASSQTWQWQSLVENLQLAHQELSVIIDLINTVEANDAITVAGMTRPKQLPNELLADFAVSTATKLQCYRHLGKYFKQSAKALEQQVAREGRFYGALIRLQQNWKVKRHRMAAATSGNEGFYIDLLDNSLYDPVVALRPSAISTVRVEHDPAGMLALNLPPKSCHCLQFKFLGSHSSLKGRKSSRRNERSSNKELLTEYTKDCPNDDEYINESHSILRKVHLAIFDEQVFDLVNREAFNPSSGVNVTGIQENYLRLSIGEVASISISLVPSSQDDQTVETPGCGTPGTAIASLDSFRGSNSGPKHYLKEFGCPSRDSYEIYLQQIFHEHVLVKAKYRLSYTSRGQISCQPAKECLNLLGHFCMSLAHRIFSTKVLTLLEDLVGKTPFVRLTSHPTWHSRTSSWSLSMKVPQSILLAGRQPPGSGIPNIKDMKFRFWTMVVVNDDCISVEGEGAPNIVGLFNGKVESVSPMNRYNCDLADLPVILLQQIAGQVIRWLHEEACTLGIKTNRDFLSLSFELDQGEILALVAHIDPEDAQGCISWWLVMEDRFKEEYKSYTDISNNISETRKFLGYLSLDVLYSTVLDFVSLCGGYGIC